MIPVFSFGKQKADIKNGEMISANRPLYMYIYRGFRGLPLTRWILYGKIRILQRTGGASPDRPARKGAESFEKSDRCRADQRMKANKKKDDCRSEKFPAIRLDVSKELPAVQLEKFWKGVVLRKKKQ